MLGLKNTTPHKQKIQEDVLRILEVQKPNTFYFIASHFAHCDFYIFKEYVRELIDLGYVKYDATLWSDNQIALEITKEGKEYIQIQDKDMNPYKKETWLMSIGVLASVGFMFLFSITLYQFGTKGPGGFQADILEKEAESVLYSYFNKNGINKENYEIYVVENTANIQTVSLKCINENSCIHKNTSFVLKMEDGEWRLYERIEE